MKQKKIVSVILVFCMLFSFLPVAAFADTEIPYSGTCGENLTWEYADGVLTIRGTGDMDSYEYNEEQPWNLTLLYGAASASVTVIVEEGVTSIGAGTFNGFHSIAVVELPDSVTRIEEAAFAWSENLSNVNIPETVTYIGDLAFAGTAITTAVIPDNHVQIGEGAFEACSELEKLVVPASAVYEDSIIDDRCTKLIIAGPIGGGYNYEFGWTDVIPDYAFKEYGSLETIVLPDVITSIGEDAFYECSSLKEITLPASLQEIRTRAFCGCANLGTLVLPDGLKTIGDFAFSACTSLNKVTLPDSLETLGDGAFNFCSSLTSIVIPDGLKQINENTFRNCYGLEQISLGSGIESIGDDAFWLCTALSGIHIPEGVKTIGENAFGECSALTQVSLPSTLETIENSAFEDCTSLTSIVIPDGVTTLYHSTFKGCSSLTSVTLPASLTTITGAKTFRNCPQLTAVYFYGDAPAVEPADDDYYASFDADTAVLYYLEGKEGWTSPTWNGYQTAVWEGELYPEQPDVPVIPDEDEPPVSVETIITGTNPVNGATNVGYDAADLPEFHIQFNKVPATMNGAAVQIDATKEPFAIYRASDDALIWEEPSAGLNNAFSTKMVINNDNTIVTVTPSNAHALLEKNTEYYITMGEGYIKFEDGTTSPAIEKGDWSFKTKNPDVSITQDVTIRTGDDDKETATVSLTWKDSWFDNSSNYYMHDLATTAMGLSGAAYVEVDGTPASDSIITALNGFGFSYIETFNYGVTRTENNNDLVSYSFAAKKVEDNGLPYELIVITIKGTSGDGEWYSNFNVGQSNRHKGFQICTENVMNNLNQYLLENNLNDKNLKFLVTGHSRGAAVANLVAKELTNSSLTQARNVYGYTFATPAVTTDNTAANYNNIFNIVNAEDFVTRVPLVNWNYKRYGIDLLLPSQSFYGTGYTKIYDAMRAEYRSLVNKEYQPYNGTQKVDKLVADVASLAPTVKQFYENKNMGGITPHQYFYYLADFIVTGNWVSLGGASIGAYGSITGFFAENQMINPRVFSAHSMAAYYSWMDSCTAEELFGSTNERTNRWFKRAIIACPVDVYVYDENGNLAASVENETVGANTLVVSVEDGVKTIDMPNDQEYDIRIVATGEGVANYTIEEYQATADGDDVLRTVEFIDLPLEKDKEYSGKITVAIDVDNEAYALTTNNDEVVFCDKDSAEKIAMYRLYSPISGEHFYTSSEEERYMLVPVGWIYEGLAWYAPKNGAPVYRLYSPVSGDHHYTVSMGEVETLESVGWIYEGIAWYTPKDGQQVYRLYSPYLTRGSHHYTISEEERDILTEAGWIYEGIGWYAL